MRKLNGKNKLYIAIFSIIILIIIGILIVSLSLSQNKLKTVYKVFKRDGVVTRGTGKTTFLKTVYQYYLDNDDIAFLEQFLEELLPQITDPICIINVILYNVF